MLTVLEQLDQAMRLTGSARNVARPNKKGVRQAPEKSRRVMREQEALRNYRKSVSSTNAQYSHGQGGIFSMPGTDQIVYSTIIRPLSIAAILPMYGTRETHPMYEYLTEQEASSGSEPSSECGTPIKAGKLKVAFQTAPFGRVMRATDNILANNLGKVTNRAEPMDLRIMNDIGGMSPWIPDNAKNTNITNDESAKQFFQLGIEFERVLERMTFSGNSATMQGTYPDYGYREFNGYSILINNGKIDANSGVAVTAADPIIIPWNAQITAIGAIGSTTGDIVQAVSTGFFIVLSKSESMGLQPAEWFFAMQPSLFQVLTAMWPCSYLTNGCTTTNANGSTTLFVDSEAQIRMRDEMRGGNFLWVQGYRIPVFKTDAIPGTAAGGGIKTDIYMIIRSARGGYASYYEYFLQDNPQAREIFMKLGMGTQFFESNGGLYLWTFDRTQYCFNFTAKTEPRLHERIPWLCVRITGIVYNPGIAVPSAFPGDLYPAPGGGSGTLGTPSLYNGF